MLFRSGLSRFYAALKAIEGYGSLPSPPAATAGALREGELAEQAETLRDRFREAMDDDFNTARAIGCLFEIVRVINAALAEKKAAVSPATLVRAGEVLREVAAVLGLLGRSPAAYLELDRQREATKRGLDPAEIESLIAERRAAREAKAWQRADEIRQGLAVRGVILQDGPTATTWSIP